MGVAGAKAWRLNALCPLELERLHEKMGGKRSSEAI